MLQASGCTMLNLMNISTEACNEGVPGTGHSTGNREKHNMDIITNKDDGYVEWKNGEQSVKVFQRDILFAHPHEKKSVMIISKDEGSKVCSLYDLNGAMILKYKQNGHILDTAKGQLSFTELVRHADYDRLKRTYVIMLDENECYTVYLAHEDNIKEMKKLIIPDSYEAEYLMNFDGRVSVVLRALTEENCDQYGRSDWRFKINFDSCTCEKLNIIGK